MGTRKCLGQHVAESSIKALIVHLFSRYRVTVKSEKDKSADYKVDKTSWVPLADVELVLNRIEILDEGARF